MDMYIRQKVFSIGDRYNVFDINQNLLYRVEGEILTFGAKLHLCDPSGGELLYIEQELFHMMPRYNLYCRGTLGQSPDPRLHPEKLHLFRPQLVGGQRIRLLRHRRQRIWYGIHHRLQRPGGGLHFQRMADVGRHLPSADS